MVVILKLSVKIVHVIKNQLELLKNYTFQNYKKFSMCNVNPNNGEQIARRKGPWRLAVFDFDYTVVAQNTDTVVRDLIKDKLPKNLDDIIDSAGWTEYMGKVFQLLHQHHITPEQIRNTVRGIPEVPGFVRLIKWLKNVHNFDMIIISDSNSLFISEWLKAHSLGNTFENVYTNPATFDESGLLNIKPYHHQTECEISAVNLCKGKIMEHYLVGQDLRYNKRYDCIVYVGDGNNDICPILRLRHGNFACAREGFAMDRNIRKNKEKMKLRADVIIWKNGFDLLHQLEQIFDKSIIQDH